MTPIRKKDALYDITLAVRRRKGTDGKPRIAPFVNGRNVWDIRPKNWTDDVQKALLSAYAIGYNDAVQRVIRHANRFETMPSAWPEVTDDDA